MMLTLSIQNAAGKILASAWGGEEAVLVYEPEYQPGDTISLSCDKENSFVMLHLEDTLAPAFVFLKGHQCTYPLSLIHI